MDVDCLFNPDMKNWEWEPSISCLRTEATVVVLKEQNLHDW